MSDSHDKALEDLLKETQAQRRAVEEPSFEQLEAYARGAASPEVCRQVEAALEPGSHRVVGREVRAGLGVVRGFAHGASVPWAAVEFFPRMIAAEGRVWNVRR